MNNFHSCTVHLDAIKVFYLPTDAQQSCFKRILKFTLKLTILILIILITYNFSKAQIIRSLMMVIEPKHVGAVLM